MKKMNVSGSWQNPNTTNANKIIYYSIEYKSILEIIPINWNLDNLNGLFTLLTQVKNTFIIIILSNLLLWFLRNNYYLVKNAFFLVKKVWV